jgi:ribosomal protein L7Ae-like RNA K-turn-binding protein
MTERELRVLGLARRAGQVVIGSAGVRAALQRDEVALVVVCRDLSRRTEEKVVRLANGRGVRVVVGPEAVELGRQVGRSPVQSIGVRDPRLARGIGATELGVRRKA